MESCSGSQGIAGHPTHRVCSHTLSSWPCSWILPGLQHCWGGFHWSPSCGSFHGCCSWYSSQSTEVSWLPAASSWALYWEDTPVNPSVTATVLRLRGQTTTPQVRHVACHTVDIDLSQGRPQELSSRLGLWSCGPAAELSD